jgi:hypothetical protein
MALADGIPTILRRRLHDQPQEFCSPCQVKFAEGR